MKLSIIIPVYNQEELVIKCLDSIPKRNDIEILVIDDGSTDNTYKNLLLYKTNNENIKLFRNFKNQGVGFTRNVGIENATGEYVMFLDSDDYLYPKLDDYIKELTGEDMIWYGLIENDGTKIMPKPLTIESICGTVKSIKRDFIKNTRYPNINFAEDWVFNRDLLKRLPTKKFTDIYLLHYNHPRKGSLFDLGTRKGE